MKYDAFEAATLAISGLGRDRKRYQNVPLAGQNRYVEPLVPMLFPLFGAQDGDAKNQHTYIKRRE